MKQTPKLVDLIQSIRVSNQQWPERIYHCWQLGNQAGFGFAIGEADDSPAQALTREGYELIAEIEDLAIGTNYINSIIAVTNNYSPWAVDITEHLTARFSAPLPRARKSTKPECSL